MLENGADFRHRKPEAVNEVDGVGAEQHELSVRELEDAHHSCDDADSQHHEDHDGPEAQDFEGGVQRAFDAVLPAGGLRWPGCRWWSARQDGPTHLFQPHLVCGKSPLSDKLAWPAPGAE